MEKKSARWVLVETEETKTIHIPLRVQNIFYAFQKLCQRIKVFSQGKTNTRAVVTNAEIQRVQPGFIYRTT